MFDDDTTLWRYVLQPLYTQRFPPVTSAVTTFPETNDHSSLSSSCRSSTDSSSYLLPFVRSLRTASLFPSDDVSDEKDMISLTEDLCHRLRCLLLLESFDVSTGFDECVGPLAQSLRWLPFLTSLRIDCNAEGSDYWSDLVAAIPNPQQIRKLHLPFCTSLTQEVLDPFTRLEELDITGAQFCNVINVDFCCRSLRRLYAPISILCDADLVNATSLEVLNVDGCRGVTTVEPFAATLVELHAEGLCGIDDIGLKNAVHIRRLFVTGNTNITTVKPFAAILVELDAAGSGIKEEGLDGATSIVKLDMYDCGEITFTPFAHTLRELVFPRLIDEQCLCEATGLVKLTVLDVNVTTVKPFARTLRELHCMNSCLGDDGLCEAAGIVRIWLSNAIGITTLASCGASLLELDVLGTCMMRDDCLKYATSLVKLNASDCGYVTSVTPFAATLRELRLNMCSGIRAEDALREAPGIGRLIVDTFETMIPLPSSLWTC